MQKYSNVFRERDTLYSRRLYIYVLVDEYSSQFYQSLYHNLISLDVFVAMSYRHLPKKIILGQNFMLIPNITSEIEGKSCSLSKWT